MANNTALLANIFQSVSKTLVDNQQALNQADEQNHDHGTNMVQTFQTITRSLEKKQGSPESDALAFAAQQLSKQTTSGSGKLYAQNLLNAAGQLKGQTINAQTGMQLLQTLLGSGQAQQQQSAQAGGGDILGSLLGGLAGGGPTQQAKEQAQPAGGDLLGSLLEELTGGGSTQPQQQSSQPAGGDVLGSLLGGLTGAGQSQSNMNSGTANSGLDVGDLLNAGMAFMQAKQSGGSTASALIQAFVAGSGMGNSNHRTQSTQLVASSFLQALGGLTGKTQ
jgi:DAK2 domain